MWQERQQKQQQPWQLQQQQQPWQQPQQQQQQQQLYQQQQYKQTQVSLQELKYTLYQDMQNVINILYETAAVIDYFKNDPNHQMLIISLNRFITQVNISNMIHVDVNQAALNYQTEIMKFKQELKQLFDTALNSGLVQHAQLQPMINSYLQTIQLNRNTITQLEMNPVNVANSFNNQTIQKIVNSMSSVDSQYAAIRNGKQIESINPNKCLSTAKQKYHDAQNKLQMNFPKHQQQQKQPYQQQMRSSSNAKVQSQILPNKNSNVRYATNSTQPYSSLKQYN